MRKIVTLLSITALFWACNKDNDDTFVQQVTYQMEVTYGKDFDNKPAEGVKITLLNQETGSSYEATTNSEGKASVSLYAGTYNINASQQLSKEKAETITGVAQEAVFNGSLSNITITTSQASQLITLQAAQIGNLVIKQVYYQGSDAKKGANYRDQFIEIYNNSNQTIYLDGICFARITGAANPSVENKNKKGYLANGQYDWSLAQGVTDASNANTKYVFSQEVIAFPGSGKDYPLEAGKSVFLAQNALNHKINKDKNGVESSVPNPELTIDLSNAQFEAYYGKEPNTVPLASDIDNPNVPDMTIMYKSTGRKDLILDNKGWEAIILFTATKAEIDSWAKVPLPTVPTVTETTVRNVQIPISRIIDGTNFQHYSDAKACPHRLQDVIDAGEIKGIGQFSSKAAIRKVKTTIGGRTIYQDTNNSSNDFDPDTTPDISKINEVKYSK